uniref:Cyclin-dependent kinase inhibitor domain-containing protein n=1 Tax=Daphnia galeata TaxID=27404 RepID=A0A8J2WA35_9CRUS|nr:unnamed protein product [Daphnia galeata]
MSTRVLAAPVLLDVRMSLPSYSRLGGGGRPRIVPNAGCLSRVKRCLFGPSSPGEALQQAADELQRQTESDSKRWNFDFVRDKPLDGPLNWQLAEPHSNRMETTTDPVSPARLRQSQITEYLQPRKRTSSGTLSSINNKRLRMQTTTSSPQAGRT